MFGTEVVGDVISIGSPEDGGDILMMGVGIGTMRGPIDSVIKVVRGRLSVLTAMCAVAMVSVVAETQVKLSCARA